MTLERCVSFLRDSDARLAERAARTRHGVAYFCDSLPRVWYRNVVSIDPGTEASAAELALEAEAVQAKLDHRKVTIMVSTGGASSRAA